MFLSARIFDKKGVKSLLDSLVCHELGICSYRQWVLRVAGTIVPLCRSVDFSCPCLCRTEPPSSITL